MSKMKIYLDTSAIGYLDEKTSPTKMKNMLELWEEIRQGFYDVVLSDVTLNEIHSNLNTGKVETLLKFLSEIEYDIVNVTPDVENIASLIKEKGLLLSDKHHYDRLHIGCAIIAECDILVSLNFKHLVNVKTIQGVREITNLGDYQSIDIVTPAMLLESEDESDDSE